jgi:uncharacterized UPF0160 family protein
MNLHCIIHSFLQVYILGLLHERWWVLFQVEYYIALTCMQYPKGHVSYCYQVAYINFSHFHLLLKNHWTNMNQTYILSCDSVTSNNTLSWYTSIWSNFDLWVSEATLIYEYLKQLWFMSIWSNFDLWVSEATLIYEYLKQLWSMSIWSNFDIRVSEATLIYEYLKQLWFMSIWSNFDIQVSEATLIYEYLKQLCYTSIWNNFDLWVSEATLIYEYLK